MIPVSYYAKDELTSPKFAFAFAKGCGGQMADDLKLYPGPVALFGSPSRWPILREAQAQGREWYYADHGYFRRHQYFRITKNAYQHDGRGQYSPERYQRYFKKQVVRWRNRDAGGHILVCPNSSAYFGLYRMDGAAWLEETCQEIRKHTDRPIRVRWKTNVSQHWPDTGFRTHRPIHEDLQGCWAAVVFSSVSAIDALCAGVPIVTLAPWGCTRRMGLTDVAHIESPSFPGDREPFLWALAHHQWTINEIYQGLAWRELNKPEPQETPRRTVLHG